jgi:16S rRNA (uracil1498-N3)-methyltransferase
MDKRPSLLLARRLSGRSAGIEGCGFHTLKIALRDKTLRRFFVDKIRTKDKTCTITGAEAKHIARVLRMGPGDRLILMDGDGKRFQGIIESISSREVRVRLEKSLPKPPSSPVEITLCQAILKSRPMDYLVQKTSELGVDLILPFISERTVIRLDKGRLANKMTHWREIAYNAAKQSNRRKPVEIGSICVFKELIAELEGRKALKVVLWEEEEKRDLRGLFESYPREKKFVGIVGPEGGFDQSEIATANAAGFTPVSFGNRILRSETAAIAMVSVVQYELGDLSQRNL